MVNLQEGDFVMGMTKVGTVHGRVEHIMTEGGTLGTPGSQYALESMPPDNPAMSVKVYKEESEGKWKESAYSVGMMYANATKLVSLENHIMDSEKEMAMYDSSIGKSYEGCGCETCKKLGVACKDCPKCSEEMEMGKSYQSDNEDMDKWDNMQKACWVGYEQRGMKEKDGRMVPNCVPASKGTLANAPYQDANSERQMKEEDKEIEEARRRMVNQELGKAENVSVGDHVTFAVPKPPDKTESAHGVVERVERSGTVKLPGTNESVEASSDNPVAVVRVYATNESGKRTKTDRRVVKPFSSLRVSSEPIDNEKMYDMDEEMEKVSSARLQELADAYNKNKEGDKRITVGALRQVYNRGIGAYRTNPSSVRGSVASAEQWAMGRVNAFMAGLRGKFPRKSFDLDLFPKGHPRSTKKSMFEEFAKEVDKPVRVRSLFSDSQKIEKDNNGWSGSAFDFNPFKR